MAPSTRFPPIDRTAGGPAGPEPPALRAKRLAGRVLAPFARRLSVDPNAISVLGCGAMAGAAWALSHGAPSGAGVLILLSGLLDLLDGAVAREQGRATPFGALLDRVADRVGDLLVFGGIALGGQAPLWLALLAMGSVLLASYVSACLEAATRTRVGEALSQRGIRLPVLALACFADALLPGVALLAALSLWSVATRLIEARRRLG